MHLLSSPVTLETLLEASVMSLYLPVPSLVPETKALAGSQALVIGQGLAPSEATSSVSLLIKVSGCGGEDTGAVVTTELSCRKPRPGKVSNNMPKPCFIWLKPNLGTRQRARGIRTSEGAVNNGQLMHTSKKFLRLSTSPRAQAFRAPDGIR